MDHYDLPPRKPCPFCKGTLDKGETIPGESFRVLTYHCGTCGFTARFYIDYTSNVMKEFYAKKEE